jgi:hypothetical protein
LEIQNLGVTLHVLVNIANFVGYTVPTSRRTLLKLTWMQRLG